jgi:peptide deformylase
VTRAQEIRVRFTDGNFERVEKEFSGMWARVFQHEYDHLQQKFFINRLSSVKRQILKPKLAKIKRNDVRAKYPVFSAIEEKKSR